MASKDDVILNMLIVSGTSHCLTLPYSTALHDILILHTDSL